MPRAAHSSAESGWNGRMSEYLHQCRQVATLLQRNAVAQRRCGATPLQRNAVAAQRCCNATLLQRNTAATVHRCVNVPVAYFANGFSHASSFLKYLRATVAAHAGLAGASPGADVHSVLVRKARTRPAPGYYAVLTAAAGMLVLCLGVLPYSPAARCEPRPLRLAVVHLLPPQRNRTVIARLHPPQ